VVAFHAFVALASGFLTMAAIVAALTALVARAAPDWAGEPRKPGAGYVTAWLAAGNPLFQVLALAIIVLAIAAMSAMQARGKQPIWYQLTLTALSPLGVFAGGLVRMRVLGIL
jgi:hypothetical protein